MDKPATFTKDAIRAEKVKVFEQLHNPTDEELKKFFIRGQYHSGTIEGKKISLIAVSRMSTLRSTTETYASGAFFVDSDRFQRCAFLLPYWKTLDTKGTMVNVVFKQTDSIFGHDLQPNVLTIYIQPNEGFSLSINGKEVGENSVSHRFHFDYETDATATGASPEPYEN